MAVFQGAQHVGRGHLLSGRNLQDAMCSFRVGDFVAGVICDGCSDGAHSEVGAALGAQYLTALIDDYRNCTWLTPIKIAAKLERRLTQYLQTLLVPYQEIMTEQELAHYVENHLLFTVVGFIWTPEESVFFYCGDGTILINDEVHHLNVGNKPLYPAYRLIPYAVPKTLVVPPMEIMARSHVTRLGIGSDAFKDERDLIREMWRQENLQRTINLLSEQSHAFYDDVSIMTLEMEIES